MKQDDSVTEVEQSNALKSFLEKKKPSTPPKASNNSQSIDDFGLAPLLQVRGQQRFFLFFPKDGSFRLFIVKIKD